MLILTWTVSTPASSQGLRDEGYARAMQRGIDHLYRLEHPEAVLVFEDLADAYPAHPGPPLAIAMSTWLEELFQRQELDLDRFISPGYFTRPRDEEMDPGQRERFFAGVERSRELAERWLEQFPGDLDARYYLGASEGALGVFAFTIDRSYRAALGHGRASYEIHRALIDDAPEFADSYLTVGTYEYIVGNLPWYIKWIAIIAGYRGSEARGFDYLLKASTEGFLVRNDARVLLMVLYVREEENEYALQLASQLHQHYPENFLLHLNRAQILERLGRRVESADMLLDVVHLAERRSPSYQKLDLSQLRYPLATRLAAIGRRQAAVEQYDALALDENAPDRERVRLLLEAGRLLEQSGSYPEAQSRYWRVQTLDDIGGSHRAARKRLRELERERDESP